MATCLKILRKYVEVTYVSTNIYMCTYEKLKLFFKSWYFWLLCGIYMWLTLRWCFIDFKGSYRWSSEQEGHVEHALHAQTTYRNLKNRYMPCDLCDYWCMLLVGIHHRPTQSPLPPFLQMGSKQEDNFPNLVLLPVSPSSVWCESDLCFTTRDLWLRMTEILACFSAKSAAPD